MGSVSAAEILNLETYVLNFLATNQKNQTELKKKQRLADELMNRLEECPDYF